MQNETIVTNIRQVGLSTKESALYLAALSLGEASLSEIAKEAGLKWTSAYNLVHSLLVRGFLIQVPSGKRGKYAAVNPRRLLQIAELHKNQIEEALPELTARYRGHAVKPRALLYEGVEGVRQAYKEIYAAIGQKELLWFSDIEAFTDPFPLILNEYVAIIRKSKNVHIRELVVDNAGGRKHAERFQGMRKAVEVRFLPKELSVKNLDEAVVGNRIYQFVLGEHLFVSIIENETITQTRKSIFDYLWTGAKKP